MTEPIGPALARQRLSTHLRNLRGDRPAAEVVKAMHWSLSKLNRVENNKVTIQPLEVEALARFYGLTDRAELDRLLEWSVASRQRMWWRGEGFPEELINFIAFENDASHLYGYHATFVPPLLQTRDYAIAVTAAALRKPADDPGVGDLVDARMRRREVFLQRLAGRFPPSLSVAIDEAVLLRPVGGEQTMKDQLEHLSEMNDRPTVRLVVLPLSLGAHPGLGGTFELLSFAEDDDLDVVFIETLGTDFLITDEETTATFRDVMNRLLETDPDGRSLAAAVQRAARS